MAEIGMLRDVWDAKIQLCWWHLWDAVRKRLGMSKVSTTPYNVAHAQGEFEFIDPKFVPPGRLDINKYEGGMPDDIHGQPTPSQLNPNSVSIHISIPESFRPTLTLLPQTVLTESVNTYQTKPIKDSMSGLDAPTAASSARLTIKLPGHPSDENQLPAPSQSKIGNGSQNVRRTFCAEEYKESIVDMMATHLCAHPLIPGYARPSPKGIRYWAVQQMYNFCVKHDLREVWAYLWENWYRTGRWELWARAACAEILILKATMILESQ